MVRLLIFSLEHELDRRTRSRLDMKRRQPQDVSSTSFGQSCSSAAIARRRSAATAGIVDSWASAVR